MTLQEARQTLLFRLYDNYDNREAANIADLVLEHLTGWKKLDRIINKSLPLNENQKKTLLAYSEELGNSRPVQYVLNQCWFYGYEFWVDERVLIPRPETEELVHWIINDNQDKTSTILEIGTGSGCIPIVLKKKLAKCTVSSLDISSGALEVAGKNGEKLEADVEFIHADFLSVDARSRLKKYDIIVSNPPYIPEHNRSAMSDNVLRFEPSVALFVPNEDAMLFYKAIADFAINNLHNGGHIYVEIHEDLGPEVVQLFRSYGYQDIVLRKDMQGKDRMIRITK